MDYVYVHDGNICRQEENICRDCLYKVQCKFCEEYVYKHYLNDNGLCKSCPEKLCKKCNGPVNEKYDVCYSCKFLFDCISCGKKKIKYKNSKCYVCIDNITDTTVS